MRLLLPTTLALVLSTAAAAQTVSGSYLAARQAVIDGDHAEAATYFEQALRRDGDNLELITNGVLARAALGQWDRALEIGANSPPGREGRELINIVEQVDRISRGNYAEASEMIGEGRAAGPLVDDLSLAWMLLGQGDMSGASALLDEVANAGPLADIARYHLALMRASVGDYEGADAILSGAEFGPLPASTRSFQAHAQILAQLGRTDDAISMLDAATAAVPDPALTGLRAAIQADADRAYDFLVTPQEGAAEVFYTVARGLGTDSGGILALVYARAAAHLREDHADAVLLAAEMLEASGQLDLAEQAYSDVAPGHPLFIAAEIGRAGVLMDMAEGDAAVAAMTALAADFGDVSVVHGTLGDIFRRLERFEEAIEAYTTALNLVDQTQTRNWFLFYTRAIAYEREGLWDNAEVDFRRALELNPEQPNVLNYLGYSLVEQRRNFDEALNMIERAVAARPDSGYIVDSLGWVLFRLGRFEDAVEPMERAVALVPTDPVINDHLGDVYWMVGRTREAEFQWIRALSFEPDEEDAERIRRKLEIGLSAVLEEEGGVGLLVEE
ncbi:MAG: tetratricopeptide repeat protein [Pseudomonadota bacterium]